MATTTVPTPAPGDQIDPHLAWWAEAQRLYAEREQATTDDDCDAKTDELWKLWELIGATRARTLAGARIQIDCVADQLVTGVSGGAERERTALANAAATLDRLATSKLLAKFEEMWDRLGGGWEGDGGEQILAREIRDELRALA